jgi:Rap1a immunity proteins
LRGFVAGSFKQAEASVLRAFLVIALCAVLSPPMALAAADAPGQAGAFVAYCKTNSDGCADKIAGIYATMLINSTIAAGQAKDREWCPAKEANDMKVLTPKVMGWLIAHPEAGSKTTNDGIKMAVIQLYPCKR